MPLAYPWIEPTDAPKRLNVTRGCLLGAGYHRVDMPSDLPPPAYAASLPLPHTVGMAGPDVDLIESGIEAYHRNDFTRARADFRRALAIRSQTAVANFNLGVTQIRLGDREAGAQAMRLGFALARDHGMGSSPQASSMRRIAAALRVPLD